MTGQRPPRVFISYSHDSLEHAARVLKLANDLRRDGIDAIIDQYFTSPAEGWPLWMERHVRDDDFVVMVCTETYYQRVINREKAGLGLGVRWEGALIYNAVYTAEGDLSRFVPVLLDGSRPTTIPDRLRGPSHYLAETPDGYEGLLRRLFDRPGAEMPPIGERPALPQRSPEWTTDPVVQWVAKSRGISSSDKRFEDVIADVRRYYAMPAEEKQKLQEDINAMKQDVQQLTDLIRKIDGHGSPDPAN